MTRSSATKNHKSGARRERQIVRILAILRILSTGRPVSLHQLAKEFGTRRETIYRDLRVLQDAGYPIGGDETGRLSRPRLISSGLPAPSFTTDEIVALQSALSQATVPLPGHGTAASAGRKLSLLSDSPQLTVETWHSASKNFEACAENIIQTMEALLRRLRCQVTYRKPGQISPKSYDFDPYRLLVVSGGLYVLGCVPRRGTIVPLAVERIVNMNISNVSFEVRPGFDLNQLRHAAFGVSWDAPLQICLRFRADQAPYVQERLWHPTQVIQVLPDGRLDLSFTAGGSFEIRRWILGWGDAVQVLSPPALREEIGAIAQRVAAANQP